MSNSNPDKLPNSKRQTNGPDVVKCADHVIDLGPEGGERGGRIVTQGTPEEVAKSKRSITARFLRSYVS